MELQSLKAWWAGWCDSMAGIWCLRWKGGIGSTLWTCLSVLMAWGLASSEEAVQENKVFMTKPQKYHVVIFTLFCWTHKPALIWCGRDTTKAWKQGGQDLWRLATTVEIYSFVKNGRKWVPSYVIAECMNWWMMW